MTYKKLTKSLTEVIKFYKTEICWFLNAHCYSQAIDIKTRTETKGVILNNVIRLLADFSIIKPLTQTWKGKSI